MKITYPYESHPKFRRYLSLISHKFIHMQHVKRRIERSNIYIAVATKVTFAYYLKKCNTQIIRER